MKKKIIKSVVLLSLLLPFITFAKLDISEYKYFKEIQRPQEKLQGDFYFKIDNELYKNTNDFLTDVRIVDDSLNQVRYKIDSKEGYTKNISKDKDISFTKIDKNTYLLDFGEVPVGHWNLDIETKSTGFRRVADVFGSNLKDSRFENLNIQDGGDVVTISPEFTDRNIWYKHTKHRYLKIVLNGNQGDVEIDKFILRNSEEEFVQGEVEEYKTEVTKYSNTQQDDITKDSFLVDIGKERLPISYFIFDTDLKNYDRKITIYSSDNKNSLIYDGQGKYSQSTPYWKEVYSGSLYKQIYTNKMRIKVDDNKRYYLVVVQNDDNVQLSITGVNAFGYTKKVLLSNLDFEKKSYFVYFGGEYGTKPIFDFTGFTSDTPVELELSKTENNLKYQKEKKSIFKEKPWVFYISISVIVLILLWFVYKIVKEVQGKDKDDKDIINNIEK